MGRLSMLMFALEILLVVTALISCLSAQDDEVRALPRFVWIVLILLFPIVGPVVYFAVGRPVRTTPRSTWRVGGGFPEAARPTRAPDDDPEFLARLDRQNQRDDAELLRRWEADLRSREQELRDGQPRKAEDSPGTESSGSAPA